MSLVSPWNAFTTFDAATYAAEQNGRLLFPAPTPLRLVVQPTPCQQRNPMAKTPPVSVVCIVLLLPRPRDSITSESDPIGESSDQGPQAGIYATMTVSARPAERAMLGHGL